MSLLKKKNFRKKIANRIITKISSRKRIKIKKLEKVSLKQRLFFIPSLMSCGSILCGLWAIFLCIATPSIETSIILIILAGILDAFDGRVARFLGVAGKFGIELDSLADFISFGIAPMIIYFYYFNWVNELFSYAVLSIFPICMSLRLAKFNTISLEPIKNKEITYFRKKFFFGLAAPVGAIALMLPIITNIVEYWGFKNANHAMIYAFIISLMLVIPIPIFSHKIFHFGFRKKVDILFSVFVFIFIIFLSYSPLHCILTISALYCLTIPFSIIIYNKGIIKLENKLYYAG